MTTIHPTAIVDPHAALGEGVQIGPFCVVGAEARLGDGVELGHRVTLEGPVELAAGVKVGHGAIVGGIPQDLKYRAGTPSGVRVGPRTVIREYVTIHRSTHPERWTQIGADCLLMAMSHVAHDCRLGDHVIVINYAGITGHCEIGDRATVGGLTGMIPFTRVGTFAYVGGVSKLNADVPPYTMVDGQPATARGINVVGLRRAGVSPAERRLLQEAFRIFYRSGLAPARALDRLREELPPSPAVGALIEFIASARHGVCGAAREAGERADVPLDAEGGR